ncbi:hypothetical protein [Bradyrhizobium guangzhouense]|uniref:hypothetical protein n=1 Tax=Bradyrhizobium guangzhouense TaxID=1325095 RepID=UPI0013E8C580|nr:hypothetical protein [Bradyrhizobium guangzhouense]
MAISQYIADSSANFAFDLPVLSKMAVRSRLARSELMGSWARLTRTDGGVSLPWIAIH